MCARCAHAREAHAHPPMHVQTGLRRYRRAAEGFSATKSEATKVPKSRASAAWGDTRDVWSKQDECLRPNEEEFRFGMTMNPRRLQARERALLRRRREASTRRSYRPWWATFVCYLRNSKEKRMRRLARDDEIALPAPVGAVTSFAAYLMGGYASSTIDTALAAITAVHDHHLMDKNAAPTRSREVKDMLEAFRRTEKGIIKEKITFLPAHARAVAGLRRVRAGRTARGKRAYWGAARLARAKTATAIGFGAWLRAGEVHRLDVCDVTRKWRKGKGRRRGRARRRLTGFKIRVKRAKNDTQGRGASTYIGGARGDAAGIIDGIEAYMKLMGLKVAKRCTKGDDSKRRCLACGFFFPRLGGNPARGVASAEFMADGKTPRLATVDFLGDDLRQMMRELKRRGEASVQGLDLAKITPISLRRGGNSAAAALGISASHRRLHGRWKKDTCPDEDYLFLHEKEFLAISGRVMLSKHGE